MKSLIIGVGQIGNAVANVITHGLVTKQDELILYDRKGGETPILRNIDVLHICFPCRSQEKFIVSVNEYISKYKPMHVVIWSTVPIGTTRKIRGAVHSPVEGRHPHLAKSIRNMTRWVGANDVSEADFFKSYFEGMQLKVRVVDNSSFTEFLKLRSTAKYGINLVWTEYEATVADELDMDFELLKDFDRDYNKLYHNLGTDWVQRYILNPPNGHIGGHCIRPNAEILDSQFPSELLKMIKEMR